MIWLKAIGITIVAIIIVGLLDDVTQWLKKQMTEKLQIVLASVILIGFVFFVKWLIDNG